MKKTFIICLLFIFIFSLSACSTDDASLQTNPGAKPTNSCVHSYEKESTEATCTVGGTATYKCSIYGNTYQEYESALGHDKVNYVCTRCGQNIGEWKSTFYVDEFDNPTSEAYVRNANPAYGTFSNSATTDSSLQVTILIDENDVCIMLYEYGSHKVKEYTDTRYYITLLLDDGTKKNTYGTMYDGGDRVVMDDRSLVEALQNNNKVEVYLKDNPKYGTSSTYLFSLKQDNFNVIYDAFYKQYMK